MDKSIHQSFLYGTLWVLWILKTIICGFAPCFLGVTTYKIKSRLQKCNQTSRILFIVQSIHHSICLVQTIPTCAEQSRVTDRGIVGKQSTSISQFALLINDAKRLIVAIFKRTIRAFKVSCT